MSHDRAFPSRTLIERAPAYLQSHTQESDCPSWAVSHVLIGSFIRVYRPACRAMSPRWGSKTVRLLWVGRLHCEQCDLSLGRNIVHLRCHPSSKRRLQFCQSRHVILRWSTARHCICKHPVDNISGNICPRIESPVVDFRELFRGSRNHIMSRQGKRIGNRLIQTPKIGSRP